MIKYTLSLSILIFSVNRLQAQYVYTIKADTVKITNCDSAELVLQNHTQGVPGFLFNAGNGRTVFQRGAQQLSSGVYLVGADTIKTSTNAWLQGGNTFGTTGVLGTLDNNPIDFYTNNTARMRLTNVGKLGIGLTTPAEALDVYGNININDSVGSVQYAMYKMDHEPIISFTPAVAPFTNIAVGDSAGWNATGSYYLAFLGAKAAMNSVGGALTCVGSMAGMDNTGSDNTFIGFQAGMNNGETSLPMGGNTYIGAIAGANCTGSTNSFLGYDAGSQATGNNNTYFGFYSGGDAEGSQNLQLGNYSGQYNYGSNNVLLGSYAGQWNGGSHNVYVGNYTGYTDTVAQYEPLVNQITLIGDSADVLPSLNLTNATAIGHKAFVWTSNTMVFGDSATTNWYFNSGATPVTGAALIVGSNSSNGNGAYLSTGGTWTNASDKNKKENFQQLDGDDMLQKIDELPLTRWNYKGLPEQHIGPVAQDFYRIFHVGDDDKTISTIDPSGVALSGVQELYKKWKIAEQKSEQQRSALEKQQATIERQDKKLDEQQKSLDTEATEIRELKKEMEVLTKLIKNNPEK